MRLKDTIEAARQLGWDQAFQNFHYRVALKLGWYKLGNPKLASKPYLALNELFTPADKQEILAVIGPNGLKALITQADQIANGNFERFGSGSAAIDLCPADVQYHWSDLERGITARDPSRDIKEIWEPARFGWANTLARAYALTDEQKYLNAFLSYYQQFIDNNPIGYGSNWTSGQEVAIRLINVLIAARLFEPGLTQQTKDLIAAYTIVHAERVLKTLVYARSQNNNHYLVESIALLTAAKVVPTIFKARSWHRKGLKGIKWCLLHQIHPTGEYVQHSTNYHRLMLQAMVWAATIEPALLDDSAIGQVLLAIDWLNARVDKSTGAAPNLGANDGALLFPLDSLSFSDHRGALQQALRAFTITGLRSGLWDEGAMWLGLPASEGLVEHQLGPSILRSDRAWGELRVIQHTDRPSHADHLHFDLWWKGVNICLDPGTFSYNLPSPWDNPFTTSTAHNTVSVNGLDQMRRVSKFLYLDWGNSWINTSDPGRITASTDVWDHLGMDHQREVSLVNGAEWKIIDHITSVLPRDGDHADLRWNFPDAQWTIFEADNAFELTLKMDIGKITISINADKPISGLKLVRGGTLAHGTLPANGTEGWHSRGYLKKEPCLSLIAQAELVNELTFTTSIHLDEV